MQRAAPFMLLSFACACGAPAAPAAPTTPRAPAQAAASEAPAGSPPAAGETPGSLDWRFDPQALRGKAGPGALSTLDREHELQVRSTDYDFGGNERDLIAGFMQSRATRCDEPQRVTVRGRRAFHVRCRARQGAFEHALAVSTGRTLLLATCTPRSADVDRCDSLLRTLWLPELSGERFAIHFERAVRVGRRFTLQTRFQRIGRVSRTDPDQQTEHLELGAGGELELLGEVAAVGDGGAPSALIFTVERADVNASDRSIEVPVGARLKLQIGTENTVELLEGRLDDTALDVVSRALQTSYFPLSDARYGTSEPQPVDGSWAGPAPVVAAGGESFSKLLSVVPCGGERCLEIETETFVPAYTHSAYVQGSGRGSARVLRRGLYPVDPAQPLHGQSMWIAQHSEGIVRTAGGAYMIRVQDQLQAEARLDWYP
ncbi:MAG: hypothetical protein PVI30_19185 [Myxococcales bacterium]|jgi:hypothetical protein